jgi:hypothetical protein
MAPKTGPQKSVPYSFSGKMSTAPFSAGPFFRPVSSVGVYAIDGVRLRK